MPPPSDLGPVEVPPPSAGGVCNVNALQEFASELTTLGIVPVGAQSSVQTDRVFEVARNGNLVEMYSLLRKMPHLWAFKDSEGTTPLHAAASTGKMDMAQLLAQAGLGQADMMPRLPMLVDPRASPSFFADPRASPSCFSDPRASPSFLNAVA